MYSKSAMTETEPDSVGRPFGGWGWWVVGGGGGGGGGGGVVEGGWWGGVGGGGGWGGGGGGAIICNRNENFTYREPIATDRAVAVCVSDTAGVPIQIVLNVYMPFFNNTLSQTQQYTEIWYFTTFLRQICCDGTYKVGWRFQCAVASRWSVTEGMV